MFTRAAAFLSLLPTLAGASEASPALAPAWLPETAIIEFPGEAPIAVTFLAGPEPRRFAHADYASALAASRAGDGEASYELYLNAMQCDMLWRYEQRAEASAQKKRVHPPLRAFCETMPADARRLSFQWLHDAIDTGYAPAVLHGVPGRRDETHKQLEQLWYRGNILALGELAKRERQWTPASPDPARALLVRSVGYEWLYARLCEAAYRDSSEYKRVVARITGNLADRWKSLNEDEQRAALHHARSLLLEAPECCTIPVAGPRI